MVGSGDAAINGVEFSWVTECDGGEHVIDEVLCRTFDEVSKRMILLPTKRMVHEAKLRIARKGGGFTGCIMTPRMLPRYLYDILRGEMPVIDLTTREMMIRIIMKKMDLRSLVRDGDVRAGMVQKISRTIGELISQGVSHSQLHKSARTGRSRELVEIFKRYSGEIRERMMVDPDGLPWAVTNLLRGSDIRFDTIVLYLPGSMKKLLQDLIKELGSRTNRFMIQEHASRNEPPFIPKDIISERPVFNPSIPLPGERALSTINVKDPVKSIDGADALDEIRNIFRHIKERCILEGSDPSEIRIVFPVRQSFDDLVRIASSEYDVPIDQGEDLPLEKVPIVTSILTLLKVGKEGLMRKRMVEALSSPFLVLKDRDDEPITGQNVELITRIASMGPVRRSAEDWHESIDRVLKDPTTTGDVRETASRMIDPITDLLTELEDLSNSKSSVWEHCDRIYSILGSLGIHENLESIVIHGERIYSASKGEGPFQFNVTGLYQFYEALRSIDRRARILDIGDYEFKDLIRDIEVEVSKKNIRSSARTSGVQIMGLTESVGLKMSNVYFSSMVDGHIPAVENGFRLLTEGEMRGVGMVIPDPKREQLENLAMALGSSNDPILCYHRTSGERSIPLSSFIENIELSSLKMDSDPRSRSELLRSIGDLVDPSSLNYENRSGRTFTIPDLLFHCGYEAARLERGLRSFRQRKSSESSEFTGRLVDEDLISMVKDRYDHDHTWSVTQFETFRNCPYQFFVRYILGIQELEDLEPGIPPEKKGLIFHEVVERFYNEFRRKHSEKVTRENLVTAIKLIRSIAFDVIEKHPNKGPYWDALKDLFIGNEKEKGLLECFLEVEANYDGPFGVEGTEIKFGMGGGSTPPVKISMPGDETSLDSFNLRGSIDRLDTIKTRGGDLDFIWDYKTGSRDVDKESVQVPLYLAAIRKLFPEHFPAGGGYYYVRKRGSITRAPVHGDDIWSGEVRDKEALQSHITSIGEDIQNSIQRCLEMIDTIRSGDLSPQPNCRDRYCKFLHICRRGDA
jgi:hypothetical protein